MLSHNNLWSNVLDSLQTMTVVPGDECLSMLPLSHVFERMVGYTMFHGGVIINYAESFDKVADNMREVRPTVVLSVPRFYEKVYARVLENALAGSAVKRNIFFWGKRTGDAWATYRLAGLAVPPGLKFKHAIADRLVFSKLRARTGGRVKFFVSGGAPLVGGDREVPVQCGSSRVRRVRPDRDVPRADHQPGRAHQGRHGGRGDSGRAAPHRVGR